MRQHKGYFISIEGGEGAGKTEQMLRLKEFIGALGYEVVITREPGGVKVAEEIRHILLNPSVTDMDAMTEVLLYAAARREHLIHVILPALQEGKVVISDRYFDSSVVYQGYVKEIGMEKVLSINLEVVDNLQPDTTFYFDVIPEIGLERIQKNANREVNRFDKQSLEFHNKVRRGYSILASKFPERFLTINANTTIEKVFDQVSQFTEHRLLEWKTKK